MKKTLWLPNVPKPPLKEARRENSLWVLPVYGLEVLGYFRKAALHLQEHSIYE